MEVKAVQGTSKSYIISRLKRQAPRLFERVVAGELSARAAAIEAGFIKVPTPFEQIQTLIPKLSKGERRELRLLDSKGEGEKEMSEGNVLKFNSRAVLGRDLPEPDQLEVHVMLPILPNFPEAHLLVQLRYTTGSIMEGTTTLSVRGVALLAIKLTATIPCGREYREVYRRSDLEPSNGPVRHVRRRRLCRKRHRRDCRLGPLWAGLH